MQKTDNKFSIIIPAGRDKFDKNKHQLHRAINSILNQTYTNFELIVVNDGWENLDFLKEFPEDNRLKWIHRKTHDNRAIARNDGMAMAENDWICWLDADDSYMETYLEIMNQFINEEPDYKIFNFGGIVFGPKGTRAEQEFNNTRVREPFEFEDHSKFKSGTIATGHFIFHKSIYDDIGGLPPSINVYHFADLAKTEMPEIKEWYGPLYAEGGKELGNPWGDDWFYFYKMTRKYKCKTLPLYLYIQYAHL